MALAPAERVLAGMLSPANDREVACALIDDMAASITEAHFSDPTLRTLFRAVCSFRSIASAVLSAAAVADLAGRADAGTGALLVETYEALAAAEPAMTPGDTRWAAVELRREREEHLTTVALRDAAEIASGSVTEERPDGRPGRVWSGAADAREWAASRIAEIESETAVVEAPANDVAAEGPEVLRAYLAARDEDRSRRPQFGIPIFDELTGGLGRGELAMIAAPSGAGKSHCVTQMAYLAAFHQGLHVFFATSETVRVTVRNRLVSRHSIDAAFEDLRASCNAPHGLDSQQLDHGTLPGEQLPLLAAVARSLDRMEGSLWLAQSPYGQTVRSLFDGVAVRHRARPVDVVLIDYLMLMAPSRRSDSQRVDLKSVVIDAARAGTDFASGAGVPVVSPWQISRTGQAEMLRTGEPSPNALAETAEAVNSADLVVSLHPNGPRRERRFAPLLGHILKNRSGAVLLGDDGVSLQVDYATSSFSQRMGVEAGGTNGFAAFAAPGGVDELNITL